jgi:hypothetical protein
MTKDMTEEPSLPDIEIDDLAALLQTATEVDEATALTWNEDHLDGGGQPVSAVSVSTSDDSTKERMISVSSGSAATTTTTTTTTEELRLAERIPIQLYLSCDPKKFSPYQCLVRKQVEFFEAGEGDVTKSTQGRNKAIVLGQVGIRCRHCASQQRHVRARGSCYFPGTLAGIYQAAQNLASQHLLASCSHVPDDVRQELVRLKECGKVDDAKSSGGKQQWADRADVLGVVEDEHGLRFVKDWLPRAQQKVVHD